MSTRKDELPKAVVHIGKDGNFTVLAEEGVDLIFIDERVPHDRVYRPKYRAGAGEIDLLIGESLINEFDPDIQAQIITRMHYEEHGLRVVVENDR